MSRLCIWGALFLLLGACVHGARIQRHRRTKDATWTSGNSSDSTSGCVDKASNQFCQGDGWYWSNRQCCNNGYVTCTTGKMDFCTWPWKYLGNSQCCTTQWSVCEKGSLDFCTGDGWTYLGNQQCCLTSSYQQWLTCEKASLEFCQSSPWKYLGNSKCCTTQYSHCVDGASMDFCKGDGWQYLGSGKCCATGASKLNMQCGNYNMDSCRNQGGKYVGSGKCCWKQSEGAWDEHAAGTNDCRGWCSKQFAYEKQNWKIDQNMPESAYVNACIQQQINKGWRCY
eukprot:gnl/MRDRNA2_/MRDRNA2_85828_c0_seq3.p1 gnl/MRDRNA2_/MRDRNA2_85828_c0~~gnl/MRDRNA2_/MRDRNA2_85828_c0_seq3.p1  ORF type:complete len:282 (-),score=39.48 gnl/MRDRNA2_/MRDRNA2_85828_c0_seq3:8-853(-)